MVLLQPGSPVQFGPEKRYRGTIWCVLHLSRQFGPPLRSYRSLCLAKKTMAPTTNFRRVAQKWFYRAARVSNRTLPVGVPISVRVVVTVVVIRRVIPVAVVAVVVVTVVVVVAALALLAFTQLVLSVALPFPPLMIPMAVAAVSIIVIAVPGRDQCGSSEHRKHPQRQSWFSKHGQNLLSLSPATWMGPARVAFNRN